LREENARLQRDLERSLQERNRLLKKMNQTSSSPRQTGGSRVLEKRLEETRSDLDALRRENRQLVDKTHFLSDRLAESERISVAFLARIEELANLSDTRSSGHSEPLDSDLLNNAQICERFNSAIESMWRSLEQNGLFQKEELVDWGEKLRASLNKKRDEVQALKQKNRSLSEELSHLDESLQQFAADSALKDQRLEDFRLRLEELEAEKLKITKNNLQLKGFVKNLRGAVDPDVFRYLAESQGTLRQVEERVSEHIQAKPMLSGAVVGLMAGFLLAWLIGLGVQEPASEPLAADSLQERTAWLADEPALPAMPEANSTSELTASTLFPSVIVATSDPLRSGGKGASLIELPGGSFTMGSDRYGVPEIERPARLVHLQPFRISQTEVTFSEYDAFTRATGRKSAPDHGWGRGQRPVIGVSWDDARAYARWLSQQTGKTYRLPSEAEWEYAFGGGFQGIYWWGNHFETGKEVCFNCGTQWDGRSTAPVGSAQANRFGLYDMGGNVMEWVSDCMDSASAQGLCAKRVVRGADFNKPASSLRTTARRGMAADSRLPVVGFRLVREM
jgi:formylglycine-generating enzyme required for sulfatase activity